MKRFKVFKILYYGFMVVIGVILCFVMPGYNQYNALTKAIKEDIKNERYNEVPGFFASYFNNEALVSANSGDSKMFVYEATNYESIQSSNYYYAQQVYMGFIFNVSNFNTQTAVDSSGKPLENGMRIEYSDGVNTLKSELTRDNIAYIQELDFIYFYLPYESFYQSDLTSVNNIKVFDGRSENNLYFETQVENNLDFTSPYFEKAKEYVTLFNEMYSNLSFSLNGTFTKNENNTLVKKDSTLKYRPTGPTTLVLNGDDNFEVTGATLIKDTTNQYQLVGGQEVTLKAKEDANLEQIVIQAGGYHVNYNFGQSITTPSNKETLETNYNFETSLNGEGKLGNEFNSEKQEEAFNTWLESYDYAKTNYQDALSGVTLKTMLQIVFYFVIMMIIGDFLVGKHHILAFCSRLFGQNSKKKKTKEVEEVNNDYDVNFACTVNVPVGYTKPVYVTYQKDMDNIVKFELLKEHNYKTAIRTKNGLYKLVEIKADDLHALKQQVEVQVRGYKVEVVINLAYNEVNVKN